MSRSDFDKILESLTPSQRKILKRFLAGATDEEIANELVCTTNNVSRHVSNVCKAFGFRNEENEHYSYRDELVHLFCILEPDWVSSEMQDRVASPKPEPKYPGLPVEIGSPFYITPIEITGNLIEKCIKKLENDHLIRIKSPRKRGKTSLLLRVLDRLQTQNHRTVYLNLYNLKTDEQVLSNLDQFLQWFCNTVSDELELEPQIDSFWSRKRYSTNEKCTKYFQDYLIKNSDFNMPIILAIDEIDLLFDYPALYGFFILLRAWIEARNTNSIWKKLKVIVSYSTEVYIKIDVNVSPFNIGEGITLPLLNQQEIQILAHHYHQKMSNDDVIKLMKMVGGHPYLIQLALYKLCNEQMGLDQLLEQAHTETGVYRNHLQKLWDELTQRPIQTGLNENSVLSSLSQVLESEPTVQLQAEPGFRLQGLGLIQFEGDCVRISCELYRRYFQKRLRSNFQP